MPDGFASLRWTPGLTVALAFALSAGVRLSEAPRWDPVAHRLDEEHLLATNDAYAWVIGAEDPSNHEAEFPMAGLLRLGTALIPSPPAELAFWASALLGALVVVPIALWGFQLGGSVWVLPTALAASLAPAFFTRSRLGFYDTDWAVLFFPLLLGWMLTRGAGDDRLRLALPAAIALAAPWHGSIPVISLAMLWIAAAHAVRSKGPQPSGLRLVDLGSFCLPIAWGWSGAVVGTALLWARRRWSAVLKPSGVRALAVVLALAALLGVSALESRRYLAPTLGAYFGPTLPPAGEADEPGPAYPDPFQSVGEAQNFDLPVFLQAIGFVPALGALGLIGFAWAAWRRPPARLLLPLTAFGFTALFSGARFAILAAPAVGLGWAALLEAPLAARIPFLRPAVVIGTVLASGVFAASLVRAPIDPVLDRTHALALRDLGRTAPSEAVMWTWWDFGYASRHFAGLEAFADGGNVAGERLFTLGWVLASPDPLLSAQMIRFTVQEAGQPWTAWSSLTPAALDVWLDDLVDLPLARLSEDAYLVAAWETVPLLPWIQYFGSWHFASGTGTPGEATVEYDPLEFDLTTGILSQGSGDELRLRTADLLGEAGVEHFDFPSPDAGLHALVNLESGQVILLDERAYHTTLVRLLILPAERIEAETPFRLVVDRLPEARILALR